MRNRLRFGVVGTSWWADSWHIPILKSHPDIETVAICGRNRDRGSDVAARHSIARVYSDYREMVLTEGLDAVLVAAPDEMHYPVAMCALEAGLHVVCEKPMALTVDQARIMYDKAASAGLKTMIFFTYRWLPIYRKLRRLIDDGYLGRCYQCSIRYVMGYGRTTDYQWRFDAKRSLGALGDIGSHAIDLARWLVGDIRRVSAQLSARVERLDQLGRPINPANDGANLILLFENGTQGSLQVSTVASVGALGYEQHILLYGERGTLEAYATMGGEASLRGLRGDDQSFLPIPIDEDLLGGIDAYASGFIQALQVFCHQPVGTRLFAEAVLADKQISPNFHDGLMAQAVIDAAFRSSEGSGILVNT